jgi:hypothetical protein
VFVHRFNPTTNITRVTARLGEGQFFFDASANLAFNVTSIVRAAR